MTAMLVPTRSIFSTEDEVAVELRDAPGCGTLRVTRLGDVVAEPAACSWSVRGCDGAPAAMV